MVNNDMDDKVSHVIRGLQERFVCLQCGNCCDFGGNPPLFQDDINRIAEYFGCDPKDGTRIPVEPVALPYGTHRFTLTRPCYFKDKAGVDCMVHDAKPQACRDYPFVLWAKGGCSVIDVLMCPEAMRLFTEHFGIGQPSKCDKDMEEERKAGYDECWQDNG